MQYTNRHLATKKIHMIAFRLILLRIKFTTCATCHAFYLKRYQTSCSFCVYIVSTHHATILIASLILQIPPPHQSQHNAAKFSYFTQFSPPCLSHPPNPRLPNNLNTTPPNSPTSPNFPLPASLILQIPHLPINLNTTPPNSPNSPPYAPNSLPHSAQIPL